MKSNYSEPKIYTGGIQIAQWSGLSKAERKRALDKDWYLYYSFRDPETHKLKRQPNIKAGANRFKTKSQRLKFLKVLQRNLSLLLQEGYSPYAENSTLPRSIEIDGMPEAKVKQKTSIEPTNKKITIEDGFDLALKLKERTLAKTSYPKFKSKINQFKSWLLMNGFSAKSDVNEISKKDVIDYLNVVLMNASARTRNNTRTDLNSLFQLLENNDIIPENFVQKIDKVNTKSKRNKTYKPRQLKQLLGSLERNDSVMFLFVMFIMDNLLRPIEICRLQVKDLDVSDKKIYIRAKNKLVKTKIIPEALLMRLPDMSGLDPDSFLFTPTGFGQEWAVEESSKRDYFTKRFKDVKDHFGLGIEYGLYSFRHTAITMMYQELRKELTVFEAKSKLMEITGHATMSALESYLRDIDAELPEDYSKYIKHR